MAAKFTYSQARQIASGAFSSVFCAVQHTSKGDPVRIVALKRVSKIVATERRNQLSDPFAEKSILFSLCHENVTEMLDYFEEQPFGVPSAKPRAADATGVPQHSGHDDDTDSEPDSFSAAAGQRERSGPPAITSNTPTLPADLVPDSARPHEKAALLYYIVMPYIPYNLHDIVYPVKNRLLFPQRLPLAVAKNLCLQMLRAISYIHSKRVMHRDIKLLNFLVTADGTIKLCDFGQACYFNDAKLSNVGTRNYRAIELCLGRTDYDETVDIFSLGLLFFEVVCGRCLFTATNDIELVLSVNEILGPISPFASVSACPDFRKIVLSSNFSFQGGLKSILMQYMPEIRTSVLPYDMSDSYTDTNSISVARTNRVRRTMEEPTELTAFLNRVDNESRELLSYDSLSPRRSQPSTTDQLRDTLSIDASTTSVCDAEGAGVGERGDCDHSKASTTEDADERQHIMVVANNAAECTGDQIRCDHCNPIILTPADVRQASGLANTACPFLDLLCRMLHPDPASRISARDALGHAWFSECVGSNDLVAKYLTALDNGCVPRQVLCTSTTRNIK